MEGVSVEALGAGGVVAALVVALILWKIVKLALKVVLFIVVVAVLTVGMGVFLKHGRVGLPIATPSR